MKQKVIGTYYIGRDEVELVLREGHGGEFYISPEKGKIPRIKVGAEYKEWRSIVDIVLHESLEYVMDKMYLRYEATHLSTRDMAGYSFIFNHCQLSEICARVSDFMTEALPALEKEWKKWERKN